MAGFMEEVSFWTSQKVMTEGWRLGKVLGHL